MSCKTSARLLTLAEAALFNWLPMASSSIPAEEVPVPLLHDYLVLTCDLGGFSSLRASFRPGERQLADTFFVDTCVPYRLPLRSKHHEVRQLSSVACLAVALRYLNRLWSAVHLGTTRSAGRMVIFGAGSGRVGPGSGRVGDVTRSPAYSRLHCCLLLRCCLLLSCWLHFRAPRSPNCGYRVAMEAPEPAGKTKEPSY